MFARLLPTVAPLFLFMMAGTVWSAGGNYPTYTDRQSAGRDYQVQGEYAGELDLASGRQRFGAQVIALGDGQFRCFLLAGGLPGDGWQRDSEKVSASTDSSSSQGKVTLSGVWFKAQIDPEQGVMQVSAPGGEKFGELSRVERKSPTLGEQPPEGAVELFDGENLDAFTGGGKVTDEGTLLIVSATAEEQSAAAETAAKEKQPARARRVKNDVLTKQEFGDCRLHLEFATPFMPTATGQARGNSGVYVAHNYEVQVLDSFGLEGADNECGGLYKASRPIVNMCLPPLQWQTYDIDFTAPRFDEQGNKKTPARITISHNGVVIHDNVQLSAFTPGGAASEAPQGPLMLQDHGNPVQYRNVWIVAKKPQAAKKPQQKD